MSTFYKIKDRIEELAIILGKTVAELEKGDKKDFPGKDDRLLGNATISGWYEQPLAWTSATLEKFLTYYRVSREWWKTGEGEPILTPVDKANDNNGKALNDERVLKDLIDNNDKYRLVPTIILTEYEILSKGEIKSRENLLQEMLSQAKEISATKQVIIDQQEKLIADLEKEIKELRGEKIVIPAQQA